ncbi:hypothetical protein BDK51DRAFT_52618 [Blyttiomyces helicus]|uniref:Uncharacterized protein n=1 Tax=Blyttiomyces helicus TaxID=388810 RepID=A0A4P9WS35_9FUNG|nr:hypothetical protein BDK51DRAFT_52618 [Blyttiomyces helicus]|eukprot:RKO94748.1 hypothetical protein BDK51DRAFT_52618 [Blyttiomyces helicus]
MFQTDDSTGTRTVSLQVSCGSIPVTFSNPARTNTTSTGSVVIAGGTGIVSNLYVSGLEVYVSTTACTSTSSGGLIVPIRVGIGGDVNIAGNDKTTSSISITSGPIVLAGGVGIGGNFNLGGGAKITGFVSITINISISEEL